jgi:hypothetical protein
VIAAVQLLQLRDGSFISSIIIIIIVVITMFQSVVLPKD